MIRRTIWLHYRACRLAVEIVATVGAACRHLDSEQTAATWTNNAPYRAK